MNQALKTSLTPRRVLASLLLVFSMMAAPSFAQYTEW